MIMVSFTDDFLEVGTSSKKDEYLVKALVEIIRDDEDMPATAVFYINEDGSPSTKAQLLAITAVCFQAFLVGVWHYILMNRPDNTLGHSTITDWTPTYSGTHIEQVYSAVPSNTTEEPVEPSHSEEVAAPTLEAEIVDEVPAGEEEPRSGQTGQAPKATKQVIMNNYGNGTQIEELNGTLTINIH